MDRKPRAECPVCHRDVALNRNGTIGWHKVPGQWKSEQCEGQWQEPAGPVIEPRFNGNWLQATAVSSNSKFHLVAFNDDGAEVAACFWKSLTHYPLDDTRPMDETNKRDRRCVPCAQIAEERNMSSGYSDPVEGFLVTGTTTGRVSTAGRSKAEIFATKAERLRAEAERFESKAAFYATLPSEPDVEDGEPNVVWFIKTFKSGTNQYTYGAVKAGDNLWYTTGPSTPKGYTWAQLIEWIYDADEDIVVWWATDWQQL